MIPYPDWATLQTYYAPGVSLPTPYIAAAVASGHAPPPYMWGVQTTPISTKLLDKSSENKGKGLLKKLKRLDGLPGSNGGRNVGSGLDKAAQEKSQSNESTEEDSSTAIDEISELRHNKTQKSSSEDYPTSGKDEKAVRSKVDLALMNFAEKSVVTVPSTSQVPRIESNVTTNGDVTANAAPLPRENEVLKRERRKQSNRESARRSRMRKQAETEELASKADTLGAQNTALKTEITMIMENSKKLKMENITLMDALKKTMLTRHRL